MTLLNIVQKIGTVTWKIIHIDSTLAEVDTYYPPTIEIAADIEDTIYALLNELEQIKKESPNLDFPRSEVPLIFRKIKEDVVFRVHRYIYEAGALFMSPFLY
jgi:acetolactate synthase I/II/III large subunit